jgi:molybdate/tungstate transport system ATP-binding protein
MSSLIAVENLSLRVGAFALRGISLSVSAGEILVLLGANGAGKSVTLETIAGFHRPQTGRVVVAGRDITRLPPERRRIGLVVQDFALFPHLSVAQNVAIAVQRTGGPDLPATLVPLGDAAALLSYFSIAHLANRRPQDLSAGERQRTSLARAFAAQPKLLLFDEPFSALDAPTRDQLRGDLADFVRTSRIPAIFVTHDPVEARLLADRVAIIDNGVLLQHGTAAEVFERPGTGIVARLVGCENVLSGEVAATAGDRISVTVGDGTVWSRTSVNFVPRQRVAVCIRADDVILRPVMPLARHDERVNRYSGRIVTLTDLGPLTTVTLDCGFPLRAYVMTRQLRRAGFSIGTEALVEIEPSSVHVTQWTDCEVGRPRAGCVRLPDQLGDPRLATATQS